MAIEIERKFLIKHIPLNLVKYSHHIKQGYIVNDSQKVIRVRKKANQYYLTIKGNTIGISRSEFEYAIPKNDAENLFDQFCLSGIIEKTRHYVANKNHLWEIDEFHGENDGLIVAEIELDSIQASYTMGAMTVSAARTETDNTGGASGETAEETQISVSFAF